MVTPPRFAGEGRGRYAASAVRGEKNLPRGPGRSGGAGERGWLAGSAGRRTGRPSGARARGEKHWRERGPRVSERRRARAAGQAGCAGELAGPVC